MPTVHHRYATVHGRRLFYREAPAVASPTVRRGVVCLVCGELVWMTGG
jgi:hypothetical protein